MTRVLFLCESFHPVLGGGERQLRDLATRLVASGLEATVVTRRSEAGWPVEEELDGVRVVRVPPTGPPRTGKYRMVPRALAALRREPHDVLVVRGTRVLGLPGLLAARGLGVPVVLQPEVNGELSGEVYTWGTALQRPPWRGLVHAAVSLRNRLIRDAEAFVVMSAAIRDEVLVAGIEPQRVAWIPHGIDTQRYRPATPEERVALRSTHGLPRDARIVTYVGRLLRGKGLEALVDACAGLDSHLLLVGSGAGQSLSIEAELRERVARGGLGSRVTFAGRVDDVEDWLRASDLFAFPSVFEALGLALIEAAACGLPAVASRTGGIVDVVAHGESGLLVEPGDPTALREALGALLRDPERRTALGRRARERVLARFEVRDCVDRYRALFLELSSRRPSACSRGRAARAGAAPPRSPVAPA